VLRAAGAERVRLIAVCTDREEVTDRIVALLRTSFPDTPCVARSFDRRHSLRLLAEGITPVRETFEAALDMGREALVGLGLQPEEAEDAVRDVRVRDDARLKMQQKGDTDGLQDLFQVRPEPLDRPTA
jgi:CPA2 family monovalent cation:H+ antiporter-2